MIGFFPETSNSPLTNSLCVQVKQYDRLSRKRKLFAIKSSVLQFYYLKDRNRLFCKHVSYEDRFLMSDGSL